MTSPTKIYRIAIVGDTKTGKTTLYRRLLQKRAKSTRPTEGKKCKDTYMMTNHGRLDVRLMDTPGKKKYSDYDVYAHEDGIIIVKDAHLTTERHNAIVDRVKSTSPEGCAIITVESQMIHEEVCYHDFSEKLTELFRSMTGIDDLTLN